MADIPDDVVEVAAKAMVLELDEPERVEALWPSYALIAKVAITAADEARGLSQTEQINAESFAKLWRNYTDLKEQIAELVEALEDIARQRDSLLETGIVRPKASDA